MITSEAISFLSKYLDDEVYTVNCRESHYMAIKSLKKQISKEVEIELVDRMYKWFCPVCGSGEISGNKVDKPRYCSECGQRLEFLE